MAEVKCKYKIVIEQSKNNVNSAQRIIFNAVARRLRTFKCAVSILLQVIASCLEELHFLVLRSTVTAFSEVNINCSLLLI